MSLTKLATQASVAKQLKKLRFKTTSFNRPEVRELPRILHDREVVLECANGFYEGGIALLVATNSRVLLVDKKPLNYLTVEELRFDMINEIDYSNRLMGARIVISTGNKTLRFNSFNQARLRNLIGLVQHRMSEIKQEQSDKEHTQQRHLEEINKQLQMYLLAQHQQLQQQVNSQAGGLVPKPSPQLSDYLFAQRLLEQFSMEHPKSEAQKSTADEGAHRPNEPVPAPDAVTDTDTDRSQLLQRALEIGQLIAQKAFRRLPVQPNMTAASLLDEARREVFGKPHPRPADSLSPERRVHLSAAVSTAAADPVAFLKGLEVNPVKIAQSKLPLALRNRRFGGSQPRTATY